MLKKMFWFMFVFLLLMANIINFRYIHNQSVYAAVLENNSSVVYGDVDGDGNVTTIDYALIKSYLLGKLTVFSNPNGIMVADVDGNGTINTTDHAMIKSYLLGKLTEFPASSLISMIEDMTVTLPLDTSFALPTEVQAEYANGTKKMVGVSWNVQSIDTTTVGAFSYEGSVLGYSKKVKFNLTVCDTSSMELGNTQGNIANLGRAVQKGEWIFYCNTKDGSKIYKIKSDGTYNTKVSNQKAKYINVMSDRIFYINELGKLLAINIDGTNETSIGETSASSIFVVGNWIYYTNSTDDNRIYKIYTNGKYNMKLNNTRSFNISVYGNWIYYTSVSESNKLYKIKVDGMNNTKLSEDNCSNVIATSDWVYYTNNSDASICKIKKDGTERTKIGDATGVDMFNINNDDIYYTKAAIFQMKSNGTGNSKISDGPAGGIWICGIWICFENAIDDYINYKIKLDGTEKQPIDGKLAVRRIDNINWSAKQGTALTLPKLVEAVMGDYSIAMLLVIWEPNTISTNVPGTFTFIGRVEGFSQSITLTLVVTPAPTIKTINQINASVNLNEAYTLPSQISAVMSDDTITSVSVLWNNTVVDTSKPGTFSYTGIVQGYSGNVVLNLTVLAPVVIEYGSTAGNINNNGIAVQKGDWIYYRNTLDNYKLYKIKTDGTNRTKLIDVQSNFINATTDWVYYTTGWQGNLYRVRIDGSENTSLGTHAYYPIVVGEWIYFSNFDDGYKLYKVKTDGTNKTKLSDFNASNINVVDDWVYYTVGAILYKVKIDGTALTQLSYNSVYYVNVVGGWIYYAYGPENQKLYKMRTDGTGITKINDDQMNYLNVSNDWIYYSNGSDAKKLYKIRTDGTGKIKLNDDGDSTLNKGTININIAGNWIYYSNELEADKTYRIKTDGTRRQAIGLETAE